MFKMLWLIPLMATQILRADPPPSAPVTPQTAPIHLSYIEKVILTYVVNGIGKSPEEQIAGLHALQKKLKSYRSVAEKTVQVASFEEFLTRFSSAWPHSYSIQSEIEIVMEEEGKSGAEKFASADPEVQRQIDEYMKARAERAQAVVRKIIPNNPTLEKFMLLAGTSEAQSLGLDLLTRLSPQAGEAQWVRSGYANMEKGLNSAFELIQNAGEKLLGADADSKMDPMKREVIKLMMTEYFKRVSLEKRKRIAQQLLCGPLAENIANDPETVFKTFVANAGPQFKKVLQILARESNLPPSLQEIFKMLEKSDRAIPYSIVRRIIEPEMRDYNILSFEAEPLGTGSIAQNQKGIARRKGRDGRMADIEIAIRFIKPGAKEDLIEDNAIMEDIAKLIDGNARLQAAGVPKLGGVISTIKKGADEDTNLRQAEERQAMGEKVYAKGNVREIEISSEKSPVKIIEVSVPRVFRSLNPATRTQSKIAVTEFVRGTKLDKAAKANAALIPDLKKITIDVLSEVWFEELLWGTGFYHSDPHQGNFLIEVSPDGARVKLRILDFGMAGNLTESLQESLLEVGAAITTMDAESLVESYWKVRAPKKSTIAKGNFRAAVQERIRQMNAGMLPKEGPIKWLTWSINQGMAFKYGFENLNRGVAIMQANLADANPNRSITDVIESIAGENILGTLSLGWRLITRGNLTWEAYSGLAAMEANALLGIEPPAETAKSPAQPSSTPVCSSLFAIR